MQVMERYGNKIEAKKIGRFKLGIIKFAVLICSVGLIYILDYHCIFLKYLSIPCLGCGMSRAWKSVLSGQWEEAIAYHRAFWTVPLLVAYVWKGGRLFKNCIWNIGLLIFIIINFLVNYLNHFL